MPKIENLWVRFPPFDFLAKFNLKDRLKISKFMKHRIFEVDTVLWERDMDYIESHLSILSSNVSYSRPKRNRRLPGGIERVSQSEYEIKR